jgi:hypothetical protein
MCLPLSLVLSDVDLEYFLERKSPLVYISKLTLGCLSLLLPFPVVSAGTFFLYPPYLHLRPPPHLLPLDISSVVVFSSAVVVVVVVMVLLSPDVAVPFTEPLDGPPSPPALRG